MNGNDIRKAVLLLWNSYGIELKEMYVEAAEEARRLVGEACDGIPVDLIRCLFLRRFNDRILQYLMELAEKDRDFKCKIYYADEADKLAIARNLMYYIEEALVKAGKIRSVSREIYSAIELKP